MTTSCRCSQLYMFVGPTAVGSVIETKSTPEITFMPPVRRGDIAKLVSSRQTPATMAIVDGTYFAYPAVGHIEIRDAIQRGWEVWGLSSMGAIRAFEMRDLGMRGFGTVYEEFFKQIDFQDDEVALIHGDEAPYVPLSEPLIHLRRCLKSFVVRGHITEAAAIAIAAALKSVWFGKRTVAHFGALLESVPGGISLTYRELVSEVDAHRVKREDLERFIRESPWMCQGQPS